LTVTFAYSPAVKLIQKQEPLFGRTLEHFGHFFVERNPQLATFTRPVRVRKRKREYGYQLFAEDEVQIIPAAIDRTNAMDLSAGLLDCPCLTSRWGMCLTFPMPLHVHGEALLMKPLASLTTIFPETGRLGNWSKREMRIMTFMVY
jgi:hypothetical protein